MPANIFQCTALTTLASITMAGGCVSIGGCQDMKYSAAKQESLVAPAESSFRLTNTVGDITVVADPSATQVTCRIDRVGKGTTQAKAEQALSEISIVLDDSPGDSGVTLAAKHPSGGGMSGRQWEVRWTITAPPGTRIIVAGEVGDVRVRGFTAGAHVSTDVGDVDVADVSGGVKVTTDVGDITIAAGGPIEATGNVGDVTLSAAPGEASPIKVTTDVGDVTVRLPASWGGSARATADVGSVDSDFPGVSGPKASGSGRSISGRIGNGAEGPELVVQTDVGDIHLARMGG